MSRTSQSAPSRLFVPESRHDGDTSLQSSARRTLQYSNFLHVSFLVTYCCLTIRSHLLATSPDIMNNENLIVFVHEL